LLSSKSNQVQTLKKKHSMGSAPTAFHFHRGVFACFHWLQTSAMMPDPQKVMFSKYVYLVQVLHNC